MALVKRTSSATMLENERPSMTSASAASNVGYEPMLTSSLRRRPSSPGKVFKICQAVSYLYYSGVFFAYFDPEKYTLKFIYSEKATTFCEISALLLSTVHTDKSKVEILQNFVAFSEYINFNAKIYSFLTFMLSNFLVWMLQYTEILILYLFCS